MQSPSNFLQRAHCYLATPSRRKFYIYIGLLWILNAADVWQTLALKVSGNLASEANSLVNHVLSKGPFYFVSFKALAVLLITLVLWRGYFRSSGFNIGETSFSQEQVRTAIQFLLILAIVFYLLVVYLPMIFVLATYKPLMEVPYG